MSKRLIYLVCLGLLLGLVGSVQTANAAVSFGDAAQQLWATAGTSDTMSFSWTGGANSMLVVTVAGEFNTTEDGSVTSITFGTQEFTRTRTPPDLANYGNSYVDMWYLTGPTGTSGTITVTMDFSLGLEGASIGAIVLHGVHQTDPKTDDARDGDGTSPYDSSLSAPLNPVEADGMAIDLVYRNSNNDPAPSPTSGQTLIYADNNVDGGCYIASAYEAITADSNNHPQQWDLNREARSSMVSAAFRPAPPSDPALAHNPNPYNGETGVVIDPNLSWTPGAYVQEPNGHDVYFGETFDDVNDANSAVNPNVTYLNRDVNSFDPGALEFGKTYYWRVDEINDPNVWKGTVWNFTTADHLVVDDMESYADRVSIATIWRDGYTCVDWGDPPDKPPVTDGCSGSVVDVDSGVGGGTKAMVFNYDNDGNTFVPGNEYWEYPAPYYSEIEASTSGLNSLEITRNWTCAKALSLWFYGDPNNDANDTEQMYVVLDDGTESDGVVYYDGDMNDIKIEDWQQWNIDLQDFNDQGVDLADVNNIYIGFGIRGNTTTSGGSGVVFFDDIRLYPARCVPKYGPYADLTDDCVVDYKDLDVMAGDWLQSDVIPTSDPGTANLVAWYRFEGNANDSVSPYYDGDPCGTPTYSTDSIEGSYAIEFDGVEDAVNVGSVGIDGNTPRTISCWAKATSMTIADWANVFGFCPNIHADHQYFDIEKWGYGDDYAIHVYGWEENIIPLDLEWHHLAVTYDGTTIRWYGNGELVGSNVRDVNTIDYVRMGYRPTDDSWFPGLVDDARIYDRALSDPEVAYLADTTPGDGWLHIPLDSPAELYTDEAEGSQWVNFKDFAVMADEWLLELLFP